MKDANPLLPQGTFEAQARGKSHVRIAVFTILSIHVVVLGALLIQGAGCKREKDQESAQAIPTNDVAPPFPTNEVVTPVPGNFAPTSGPGMAAGPTTPPAIPPGPSPFAPTSTLPPVIPPVVPPPVVPPAVPEAGAPIEHTIAKGDTFAGLSQKYGVTTRAIQNANPGVDPTRLKIGQKVKIPAKSVTTSARSDNATAAGTPAADSSEVYTVKSGDTLGNIAKRHGTTVSAIEKLNKLTTTKIRVGQKLKLPASAAAASAPATPPPVLTAPAPVAPPPISTPAPAPAPAPAQ